MIKGESPVAVILTVALGAALAFWARSYLGAKSQRIKDLRKKVDSISSEVDGIEDLAMSYFLRKGSDEAGQPESLKIKAKLMRAAAMVNSIHKEINVNADTHDKSLLTLLVNFRRAVTLDNFDSLEREALKASDPQFTKISTAAAKLKQRLEDIYTASK